MRSFISFIALAVFSVGAYSQSIEFHTRGISQTGELKINIQGVKGGKANYVRITQKGNNGNTKSEYDKNISNGGLSTKVYVGQGDNVTVVVFSGVNKSNKGKGLVSKTSKTYSSYKQFKAPQKPTQPTPTPRPKTCEKKNTPVESALRVNECGANAKIQLVRNTNVKCQSQLMLSLTGFTNCESLDFLTPSTNSKDKRSLKIASEISKFQFADGYEALRKTCGGVDFTFTIKNGGTTGVYTWNTPRKCGNYDSGTGEGWE